MTQDLPNCLQQCPADHLKPELTDAQRGFADVIGRELARTWIEQQTNRPQNAGNSARHKRSRAEEFIV